jgi:hypothetical protein
VDTPPEFKKNPEFNEEGDEAVSISLETGLAHTHLTLRTKFRFDTTDLRSLVAALFHTLH